MSKKESITELKTIPGVGESIAHDFWNVGIRKVSDLRSVQPQKLYDDICAYQGSHIDRCLLYVCKTAVYFARTKNPDPEKLKWWNWKDA
ncbi:helix-hairpin-helix domain-containing protein [Patescibacteria group bacterium]|nr:helix-hairpin-helix domain-containing protein [Patescibacteria group bacterium]